MANYTETELILAKYEIKPLTSKQKQKGAFQNGVLIFAECMNEKLFYQLQNFHKSSRKASGMMTECKKCRNGKESAAAKKKYNRGKGAYVKGIGHITTEEKNKKVELDLDLNEEQISILNIAGIKEFNKQIK